MKSLPALLILLAGVSVASARNVVIKQKTAPNPKRGADVIQKSVEITFPEGVLTYHARVHKGQIKTISGKWDDQFLGLSFGQATRTNGGWNLWNFLSAQARHGSKTIRATSQYLLDGVYVLENNQRSMVAMRWPLKETGDESSSPKFTMTLLEDSAMPHWIFVQVQTDAPTDLTQVILSCYPANTAGPKTRQRWVATPDHQYNLNAAKADPPVTAGALVYYNKLAQQRNGCLLVYDPSQFQSLEIAGTYAVRSIFTPKKGARRAVFALGYFMDQEADKTARDFFRDTVGGVRQYLKNIDWRPKIDPARSQSLTQFVGQVVEQHGNASEKTQWQSIHSAYDQARQQNQAIQIIVEIQKMQTFKKKLLERILSTYR